MKRWTCLIALSVICLIGCSETPDHEELDQSNMIAPQPADPRQVTTPPVEDNPPGFGVTVERNNPAAVDEQDLDEFLLITPGHSAFGVKIGDTFAQVADVHKAPFKMKGNFVEGHELHYDVPRIGVFGVYLNEQNQVHLILAIHPNSGKTAGGNSIGSVLNDVQREFGRADEVSLGQKGERHVYNQGIIFWYGHGTVHVNAIAVIPSRD